MGNRSHILDDGDFDTERLNGTHGRFTTRARSTKTNFDFTKTVTHGLTAGILRNDLSGISGAFTGPAETHFPCCGPADNATSTIGDRHDGIIEGRIHMDKAA